MTPVQIEILCAFIGCLFGNAFLYLILDDRKLRKKHKTPQSEVKPAQPPQLGPYRTADVLHKPVRFHLTNADELMAENAYLRAALVRALENATREMWYQGMADAAALVRSRNYILCSEPKDGLYAYWNTRTAIIDQARDELNAIIQKCAEHPEDSILPMLPISPHAARKVGTLK